MRGAVIIPISPVSDQGSIPRNPKSIPEKVCSVNTTHITKTNLMGGKILEPWSIAKLLNSFS